VNIPILMYHHLVAAGPADERFYEIHIKLFEQHLDWLQAWRFETISFKRLLAQNRRQGELPPRAVIISFDDAFRSFVELALSALAKRGMQATVFVPAAYIGQTNLWDQERGFPERSVMTADELRQVAASGMEIGSHGWLHRDMTICSDPEADEEIVGSKRKLEATTGQRVCVFAYPFGRYKHEHIGRLRKAGYEAATSIFSNESSVTDNPFAMRRIYIHARDNYLRFRLKLSQFYLNYLAWRGIPQ
jgi:peptidoglycan/xylan/chitin deacetylase (PgdA/CDA1 family)